MVEEKEYYKELADSVNSIFQLTSRIDERMQLMMKKQDALENKIQEQGELYSEMTTRISLLESKSGVASTDNVKNIEEMSKIKDKIHEIELNVKTLQISNQGQEGRWKTIFNFVLQLTWVLLAAFLLYKLGWQAPATP